MATIHVDGRDYEVDGADNLLHACRSLGLDIPYFCWHPAMGSVGACRQCAVKQYKNADDTQGMLVMSCMAPVQDDAYISIEDEEAKAARLFEKLKEKRSIGATTVQLAAGFLVPLGFRARACAADAAADFCTGCPP